MQTTIRADCSSIATNGYRYIGFWDGLHRYEKTIDKEFVRIDERTNRVIPRRHMMVSVTIDDITDGSAADMMRLDVTR